MKNGNDLTQEVGQNDVVQEVGQKNVAQGNVNEEVEEKAIMIRISVSKLDMQVIAIILGGLGVIL